MNLRLFLVVCLTAALGSAQSGGSKVAAGVTIVPMREEDVTVLHLGLGYTTSVKLPEEISSVVIGNPASFKVEHSEAEPRLVFFKPITAEPSETNALITTTNGQEVTLQLVTGGKKTENARVDFLIEYQRPRSFLVTSETQDFLIAETRPVSEAASSAFPVRSGKPDFIAQALEKQRDTASPRWQGKEVLAAVGDSIECEHQTILSFSVLNSSKRVIELVPPQIRLAGRVFGDRRKRIKADPIAVTTYGMTARRLVPGQRADGVVVFDRPAFKESSEELQLQLAEAEEVDRPILLPIAFTPVIQGAKQ